MEIIVFNARQGRLISMSITWLSMNIIQNIHCAEIYKVDLLPNYEL